MPTIEETSKQIAADVEFVSGQWEFVSSLKDIEYHQRPNDTPQERKSLEEIRNMLMRGYTPQRISICLRDAGEARGSIGLQAVQQLIGKCQWTRYSYGHGQLSARAFCPSKDGFEEFTIDLDVTYTPSRIAGNSKTTSVSDGRQRVATFEGGGRRVGPCRE